MPSPKVKIRKKPANKRCEKGFPCKTTCISRAKNCKKPLTWQAKTFADWLKIQEERLAVTNQKRQKAGLAPAKMTEHGYITAERTKLPSSEKVDKAIASPVETKATAPSPKASTKEQLIATENRLGKELDALLDKYTGRHRTPEQQAEIDAKQKEYFAANRAIRDFDGGKAIESPTVAEPKPAIEAKSAIAKEQKSAQPKAEKAKPTSNPKSGETTNGDRQTQSLNPLSTNPADLTTEEFAKLNYKKVVDRLIGDLENELKGSQKGITKEYRSSVNKDIAALKSISSFEDVAPVLSKIGYDKLNKIAFSDHLDAIRSGEIPKSLKNTIESGGDINKEILARRNTPVNQAKGDRPSTQSESSPKRTQIEEAINSIPDYRDRTKPDVKDPVLSKFKKDLLSVTNKIYGGKSYADQVTDEDTRSAIAKVDREHTRLFNIVSGARNNQSLSKSFYRSDDKNALGTSLAFTDQMDILRGEVGAWRDRETAAIKAKANKNREDRSEKAEAEYQSNGDRPSVPSEPPVEKTEITIDPKYATPLKGADKVTAGKAWNRRIDQQFLEMKKLEKEKQMEFLEENIRTGEKESVVRYPLTYGDNFGIVKRELGDWNIVDLTSKKNITSYPTKLDAQRFIASVLGEIGDKSMQQMSRSERQALMGIEEGITGLAKLRKTHGNPNRVNLQVPPYIRQKMGENIPSLPIEKPVTPSSRPTTSSGEIKSFKHTKFGHELFAVNPPSDPTPSEKREFASKAKSMGGRYSAYDKDGAIAGYLFRDKKKAEQFKDWMGGKQSSSQPKRTSVQNTEAKPTEQSGDRQSITPEPVKEKRNHPLDMSRADKLEELRDHYESSNPIPQFRKTPTGKYVAYDQYGSAYGNRYETESDAVNAHKEYRKKKAEDSVEAMRHKPEAEINRQIEYWRKQRGIETNSATPSTPPSNSTYQPTAKEFGDRLTIKPEDFKGNTIYLGAAANVDGDGFSYKDREWLKSKHGDVSYGNEYRIVKDGAYIAIESRPFVYKKDGNPLGDRLNEGDWKSQYGRQNIEWNQEGTIARIADFGITEKPHPLVANAVANKEKRQAEQVQREKEAQIESDKKQAKLTAWTAIKKEMVDALPKPKKGQFISYQGTDKKNYEAKADLYGDNYAILKKTGDKNFSVVDVKSGYLAYASGLTATKAKELLGVIWKERGDKPVIQEGNAPDVSEELKQFIGDFRYGREDSIPDRYSKEVEDRVSSVNSQKAQAMQSNLFGGLDEIPVDKKREDAIAVQSSVETTKKVDALNRYRPYVKPKKDNISDKELNERIQESNDYFKAIALSGGKKLKEATNAFYQDGEPGDRFMGSYDVERIFKGIDNYEETGNKQKIALTERIEPVSYYARGYRTTTKDHYLDPSDEKGILEFMRDKMNVKVTSKDTIADVRERFNKMRSLSRQAGNIARPKWLDTASSSVDSGSSIAGVGLTPTTKGFVAEQLFKLSAFDFPSAKEYDKEPPKVTIRTPGGGQYQIKKTKEAISTFLDGIGLAPKKGETLFDALRRNAETVQNFSELTLSHRDRHLLLLATTAANRIMNYPESLRQGIVNRLREQSV